MKPNRYFGPMDEFYVGCRVAGDGFEGVVVRIGEKFIWVRRDGEIAAKASVAQDLRRLV